MWAHGSSALSARISSGTLSTLTRPVREATFEQSPRQRVEVSGLARLGVDAVSRALSDFAGGQRVPSLSRFLTRKAAP